MPSITNKQIESLIPEKRGNMAAIARALGVSRTAVWARVKKSKKLRDLVDEASETFLDEAENVFYDKVLAGETPELLFFLKTKGRGRGYIERTEHTGADGNDIVVRVIRDAPND